MRVSLEMIRSAMLLGYAAESGRGFHPSIVVSCSDLKIHRNIATPFMLVPYLERRTGRHTSRDA